MSELREEFEKYWIDRCSKKGVECVLVRMIDGEYYNISAFYAYEGWKASRESLVVELPDSLFQLIEYCPSIDGNSDVEILHIDTSTKINVSEYLESQGIKVITK